MKTKNKMLALVEIAIVLCSLFLVAIPAIAADQTTQKAITTASEDDYVLGIYGNANEDDTIDMGDVVYTKLAIFGKKPKTELCDAKYDGRINVLDVIQTKLIILGKEKELTVVDTKERIVTLKKPLKRIVIPYRFTLETLRTLKVPKEIMVGVDSYIYRYPYEPYFAEFMDITPVSSQDPESIITLHPDAAFVTAGSSRYSITPTIVACEAAGIPVFRSYSNVGGGTEFYMEEITKLGYIFDKKKEAEEYIDWYESILNSIKEKVEKIPEEDKPKVYLSHGRYRLESNMCGHAEMAGGKDIFSDLEYGDADMVIDAEAVVVRDPHIIVQTEMRAGGYQLNVGDTAKLQEIREEIMSRPEMQKVTAVEEGRVYIIGGSILGYGATSGCRCFVTILYLAKWFQPELFEDINPKAIHQEYLTRFQGLDIDLDEKGVFVYHPEEHPDGH